MMRIVLVLMMMLKSFPSEKQGLLSDRALMLLISNRSIEHFLTHQVKEGMMQTAKRKIWQR